MHGCSAWAAQVPAVRITASLLPGGLSRQVQSQPQPKLAVRHCPARQAALRSPNTQVLVISGLMTADRSVNMHWPKAQAEAARSRTATQALLQC